VEGVWFLLFLNFFFSSGLEVRAPPIMILETEAGKVTGRLKLE